MAVPDLATKLIHIIYEYSQMCTANFSKTSDNGFIDTTV